MSDKETHVTLDISEGGTAGTVGNVLSSRIPIRYRDADGKTVSGFFTRNEYVDSHKLAVSRAEPLIQGASKDYPELYELFAEHKDDRV